MPKGNFIRLIRVHLPESLYEELRKHAKNLKFPISRLVTYAIDNELEKQSPFSYSMLPQPNFKAGDHEDDARKVANFLIRFPRGVGEDWLLLSRRDIGITDRSRCLNALRELRELSLLKYLKPQTWFKGYALDHRVVSLREIPSHAIEEFKQRKILKLKNKIEKLES